MSWSVDVACTGNPRGGWTCFVAIRDGATVSEHEVRVTEGDLDRLDPAASDPTDLVERSFAFLLERESPKSILRTFDLPVIGRYFFDYEAAIHRQA